MSDITTANSHSKPLIQLSNLGISREKLNVRRMGA